MEYVNKAWTIHRYCDKYDWDKFELYKVFKKVD